MKGLKILFIVISVMLLSCEKEKNSTSTDKIVFDGITSTDCSGMIISEKDPTDWNFQENWREEEKLLFTEEEDNICSTEDFDYFIIVYPNPCNGNFSLSISKPDDSRLAIRLVDKNFNVLVSKDSIYESSIAFNIDGSAISNELVRIYYKVFGEDCELKGHGDIKVE